jgi:hypothetical protein
VSAPPASGKTVLPRLVIAGRQPGPSRQPGRW